jgi:hypothetical protein
LTALVAGEKLLGFCAGKEHKQQQAEPVNKIQNITLMFRALNEAGGKWNAADEGVAQNDPGEYFANDLWLAHFYEQPAQDLSKADQEQENQEDLSQLGVRHFSTLGMLDAGLSGFVCSGASFGSRGVGKFQV